MVGAERPAESLLDGGRTGGPGCQGHGESIHAWPTQTIEVKEYSALPAVVARDFASSSRLEQLVAIWKPSATAE